MTGVDVALPSVDLVVPTINRPRELRRLLESVVAQAYAPLRVIVIDMNEDDASAEVIEGFSEALEIVHVRVSRRGVSKARNLASERVEADVVSLTDDDSWLPDGLLLGIGRRFRDEPEIAGVSVMQRDERLRPSNGRWARRPGPITKTNVWGRGVSAGIFVRASALREVGGFDEDLGPGGSWAAGEETDVLIRIVSAGHRVEYDPSLFVHHPDPGHGSAASYQLEQWRRYAQSAGHLMRKHRYPLHAVAHRCARPVLGAVAAAVRGDLAEARIRLAVATGRVEGWARSRAPRHDAQGDRPTVR